MHTSNLTEQQIQAEVDLLKAQFPQTRELYREVCVLLFFRYGITPTANKLYQYVRKGSMSAPAEALNKFWLELREKSRVRIEHPDLPESLKDSVGNLIGDFWNQAREAAQSNFSIQMAEAGEKIAQAQHVADIERENRESIEAELKSTKRDLENALQRLSESEKNHAVDVSTLANLEKSLKSLQNEREQLERSLDTARRGFSDDIEKVNVALNKAEERYRALEARALLEVDRERQRAIRHEKDMAKLNDALREQQRLHLKDLASVKKINTDLREKLGVLNGQLSQIKQQQKLTALNLKTTERQFTACKVKLMRVNLKNKSFKKA